MSSVKWSDEDEVIVGAVEANNPGARGPGAAVGLGQILSYISDEGGRYSSNDCFSNSMTLVCVRKDIITFT